MLACPSGCGHESQRIAFNHRAAAYAIDRILGRPTSRSENTLTLRLVEQLAGAFTEAFTEANGYDDEAQRRAVFAERLASLSEEYAASGGR